MYLMVSTAVLTLCLCGLFVPLARRAGLVDPPNARKRHTRTLPLAGGPAIFTAWSLQALWLARDALDPWLYAGSAVVFLAGLLDDWGKSRGRALRPAEKLFFQAAAAALVVAGGTWIRHMRVPFADTLLHLPAGAGICLSALWLVAVTNFTNFIDGMDGLMGSVTAITAGSLIAAGSLLGATQGQPLLWILLGAILGFLVLNFPPARLFAGDSGAMLIGFVLAAVALKDYLKTVTLVSLFAALPAFFVPLAEGTLAVLRRLATHRPVTCADADHTFHRLMALGFAPRYILRLFALAAASVAGAGLTVAHLLR